jgi:hypothetical protein
MDEKALLFALNEVVGRKKCLEFFITLNVLFFFLNFVLALNFFEPDNKHHTHTKNHTCSGCIKKAAFSVLNIQRGMSFPHNINNANITLLRRNERTNDRLVLRGYMKNSVKK